MKRRYSKISCDSLTTLLISNSLSKKHEVYIGSRVTTKKMKIGARKLKFCTRGLVGRPDPKIEKKFRKISRLRKMPNFDISGTYPSNFFKSCQET